MPENVTRLTSSYTAIEEYLDTLTGEPWYREAGTWLSAFEFRLCLYEALVNAHLHGHDGDETKQITVTFAADPAQVTVTVCDEGAGFEAAAWREPDEETLLAGSGRGILLMKSYMDEVTYSEGGRCVTLRKRKPLRYLPAVRQRVMLVDDEEAVLHMLRLNLKRETYAVETAGSGEEALAKLRAQPCQAVITDLRMGGMDGLELLRQVQQLDPLVPVVLMTAFSTVDVAVAALNRGAFAYLTKPVKLDELRATVRNALERERILRENRALFRELEETTACLRQIGQMFGAISDLDQLLALVLEQMLIICRGNAGLVLLCDGERWTLRGTQDFDPAAAELVLAKGLFITEDGTLLRERVAAEQRACLVMRDADTGRYGAQLQVRGMDEALAGGALPVLLNAALPFPLHGAVYVPLATAEKLTGLVVLFNPAPGATADFLATMMTVANYAVLAVERAQLFSVALSQRRFEHELELAAGIQRHLLPEPPTATPALEYFAACHPATSVGGDYYDFFRVPGRPHLQGFLISDVQGKGITAALGMAQFAAAVHAFSDYLDAPALLVERLNRFVCERFPDMLQPLVLGFADTEQRRLTLVNAGHYHPLLWRAATRQVESITGSEMILGMEPDTAYLERETVLASGDVLLLYTDGVIDMRDGSGRSFGVGQLREVLAECARQSAEDIGREVLNAVRVFGGGAAPFDDTTLIVIRSK